MGALIYRKNVWVFQEKIAGIDGGDTRFNVTNRLHPNSCCDDEGTSDMRPLSLPIFITAFALTVLSAAASDLERAKQAYERGDTTATIAIIQPLAAAGDPRAQAFFGYMLMRGEGVEKNVLEGYQLIRYASEKGLAVAQAMLALVVGYSYEVRRDPAEAATLAQKAADQGNTAGKAILGRAYLNGYGVEQNTEKAAVLLQEASASSVPMAQYDLGSLMLTGIRIEKDESKGKLLIEIAARAMDDHSDAETLIRVTPKLSEWRMGLTRFTCGVGCAGAFGASRPRLRRLFETAQWIDLAARTLDVAFQGDLSYFYLGRASEGVGDLDAAASYYSLAIDEKQRGQPCNFLVNQCDGSNQPEAARTRLQGVMNARFAAAHLARAHAARLEQERHAAEAAERQRVAHEAEMLRTAEAKRLAAEAEERRAAEEAAAAKAASDAFHETRRAAQRGVPDAQFRLSQSYFRGEGTGVDEKLAVEWLLKAAKGGVSDAQLQLGERYRTGHGIAKNELAALAWLKKASDQSNMKAQESLLALESEIAERQARLAAERAEQERRRRQDNASKLKAL